MSKKPTQLEILVEKVKSLNESGMSDADINNYLQEHPPYYARQRISEAFRFIGIERRSGHTVTGSDRVELLCDDIVTFAQSKTEDAKLIAAALRRAYDRSRDI